MAHESQSGSALRSVKTGSVNPAATPSAMNILLILILVTWRSLIPSGAEPYEELTDDDNVCRTPVCQERAMLSMHL
ncbi:hypothetical protein V5799_025862 [Amblyomma americanum]|uniref:Uncharacterized protein n=1 Tax=Amblyomma americanum TaxID=6943 RepID=A0AAQ4E844_AMBAM